jgi:hypothetical protein
MGSLGELRQFHRISLQAEVLRYPSRIFANPSEFGIPVRAKNKDQRPPASRAGSTVEAERCFSSIEEIVHEPDLTIRRVQSAAPADARR